MQTFQTSKQRRQTSCIIIGNPLTSRDASAPTLEGIINTNQNPHIVDLSGTK